jgi:HK97 family phage major capsid protein
MANEKDPVETVMQAFNEFKQTNDANLKQHNSDQDAKLAKITEALDKFEPVNQKVTLAEKQAKAMQEQLDRVETILNRPNMGGADATAKEHKEYMDAFERVMRRPSEQRDPVDVALINKRVASLTTASDTGAGYLLAPPEMQTEIIKNIVEMSPMRSLATVRTIGSSSLKQPKRTGTGSATRVGEIQARTNTGDPAYGMLEIHAPEMFARMEISQQMLEDSAYDLLAELREDASEQFAVKEGLEHISGLGASNQCEGILTNADVSYTAGGSAAAITADGLISLFHAIKTAYARNGVWIQNRGTLAAIRKLKDGQGQYLWAPGIVGNVPNTILGAPYVEMPDMPAIAADAYPIAFGDFKRGYAVVDRIAISFQTDYTTGADSGLVIFRARKRTGGGVRQAEAFRKLKIATS